MREISRCRTTGQKGMPSTRSFKVIVIIHIHIHIFMFYSFQFNHKSGMPVFFCCDGLLFRFTFSSIDFDCLIFDHGEEFSFFILLSFTGFFFFTSFLVKNFGHCCFVVELIGFTSRLLHSCFKTTDNDKIYRFSNLLL